MTGPADRLRHEVTEALCEAITPDDDDDVELLVLPDRQLPRFHRLVTRLVGVLAAEIDRVAPMLAGMPTATEAADALHLIASEYRRIGEQP